MQEYISELVLSRTILFEKHLSFHSFNNPKDVPNYIWEITYKEFIKIVGHQELDRFISSRILAPMLKEENYDISPAMFDEETFLPYKKIHFKDFTFKINLEWIRDIKHFSYLSMSWETLKEYIVAIWQNKYITVM